jgi:long-chain acyl-CoA synthetase
MPGMTKHKGSRLKTLLEDWKLASAEGQISRDTAQAILKEMENGIRAAGRHSVSRAVWHECLRCTAGNGFIKSLGDRESRYRWAETCFDIIRLSGYSLRHMMEQRAADMPDRILFEDLTPGAKGHWSYRAVARQVREIAATIYAITAPAEPRAAIFCENCVAGACCDLACLFYDILDAPLNAHFNAETLRGLIHQLRVNIVVTDSEERVERLREAASGIDVPLRILALHRSIANEEEGIPHLGELGKRLSDTEISKFLARRRTFALNEVATVMFTSGSTGAPKGVSFSIYNLVTKRFARAASLPDVGNDETLLCYLPLYHTFGRYLEMLGMIFWGGTYVFTGNPSFETLLSLLPTVNPTGLIGVPLRWMQIEEQCAERMQAAQNKKKEFRSVVGKRLRWGLSAAGYLDPAVFRFFNRNGVALSSGFGMTEATGGITMTPPWKYMDDTNGTPLPGIRTRLTDIGELELSGHYIARYLQEKGPGGTIPYPVSEDTDYWLPTGDLFRILPNGYYQMLDRIKDIYKNDKGQTIAPRVVEKEFDGVPGIKRTFLVGDRKAYNVLLIVPDTQHPMLQASGSPESWREYFRHIVSAANRHVAPYERVVNFAILDRDFDVQRGEITPKGTLNRRVVEQNFDMPIQELYGNDFVELEMDSFRIKIPRWFFRELSILEDDIRVADSGLFNRNSRLFLPIRRILENSFLIGDLEYRISNSIVDMGLLARQPRLWIGNSSLIRFCPCREGWDAPLGAVSSQVLRPWKIEREHPADEAPRLPQIKERLLVNLNRVITRALFGDDRDALQAVNEIGKMISRADLRWNEIFRRRLEALSRHPLKRIRALAYQILLLDNPSPDYGKVFPAFVASGLTFLDNESMEAIAGRFEKYQMEALRLRLQTYRLKLAWPADEVTVRQFDNLFQMLLNFVDAHPNFYFPVRAELAAWSLLKKEPRLATVAGKYLLDLRRRFKIKMASEALKGDAESWRARLVYDQAVSLQERRRIETLLIETPFLSQAVMFAFQEERFSLEDVPKRGIWISRIPSARAHHRYRMNINLKRGRHYDMELVLGEDFRKPQVLESLYWMLALGGHPVAPRVLPRPGCFSVNMRARASLYMGELTAWEKIREYSEFRGPSAPLLKQNALRKLYIQSLTAFYRGWMQSGAQIVPGEISPDNVTVPELDFKADGTIASLLGWRSYKNPVDLVKPILENFYQKVVAHYPWCRDQIRVAWIFDACMEALGDKEGRRFLELLQRRLETLPSLVFEGVPLSEELKKYTAGAHTYLPLAFYNAVDRYGEWRALNARATAQAQEQTIDALYWLYRLDEFPEIVRYSLYRQTFFANARQETAGAFDRLLRRLRDGDGTPAVQLAELFDLQSTLTREEDRSIFSRLVFPRHRTGRLLEVMRIGENGEGEVIVSSRIEDRYSEKYTFREPLEPREIGQLYNYFFRQNIPKTISELDRYYVLADSQEKIVGGICYQLKDNNVVLLEGIVVARTLRGRGLRDAMEEEFCSRMAGQGVQVVRAHFFLQNFYQSLGYHVDKRWGTLVKFLYPERPAME